MADKTREQIGKPIPDTIMGRAKALVGYLRHGAVPGQWMGAGNTLAPIAQDTQGRLTDYAVHRNMQSAPKVEEGVGYAQLRSMADMYDPLRLVIETRKDQLAGQTWTIRPKDKKAKPDERCEKLIRLFAFPDGVNAWEDWLRTLAEDMLVLDAVAVYPRKTVGGNTFAFEVVDAATIKRVVDDTGRTPAAPDVAYQQILKGVAASDYTVDELVFRMRNMRSNRFYGFSPVEQVINTVQTGLRRQLSQLNYFTDGTVPDAMAGVPEAWTAAQIKEWQTYWDDLMQGDPSKKRSIRFLSSEMAKTYKETKAPPLKDMFDEWLMRIICYAFSIDPTPFIAQVNRSVAETTREQALQEGLVPLMNWIRNLINSLLVKYCDAADLEFCWEQEEAIKPVDQATIHGIYVDKGVLTIDEVREEIGRDAFAEETSEDGTVTAGGKDIQQTALNGTQISSMMAIIAEVASKNMPSESARAMMQAAFPTVDIALVDAMLTPLANFEKPEPVVSPLPGGVKGDLPTPKGESADPQAASTGADKKKDAMEKIEVHIHNSQPDVFVDVGATTIHATVGDAVIKSASISRNKENE